MTGASPNTRPHSPIVSVIVPGRDVARFVGDAFTSLTRQFEDRRDLQVIFVDDGSTDDTLPIVERWAEHFPSFELIHNPTSMGVSAARNRGVSAVRGRYVCLLDADDWYAPGHLASLARDMDRLGCDFVRTDVIYAWGTERKLKRAPQANRGVPLAPREGILPVRASTMVDHPLPQAGLCHGRLIDSGLLHFDESLHTSEDRLWIWDMHLHADSYSVVDAPGFVYRQGTSTSLTQILDRRRLAYLDAYDAIRAMVEQDAEADRFMPKVAQTVLALTAHHMQSYDQMEDDVKHLLVTGARALLAKFPAPELEECVKHLGLDRRRILDPVLGDSEPAVGAS